MTLAKIAFDVASLDANRSANFASDTSKTASVATKPATPGCDGAGAAVFIGDLANGQELGLTGHGGTVRRLDA